MCLTALNHIEWMEFLMNGRRWGSSAKLPSPCAERGSSCVCLPFTSQNLGRNHASQVLHPVSQGCMHIPSTAVLLLSPGFITFPKRFWFFSSLGPWAHRVPPGRLHPCPTLSPVLWHLENYLAPKPLTNPSFVQAGSLSFVHWAPRELKITSLAQCLRSRNHATLSEIPASKNSNCHKYRGQREMGQGCQREKESSVTAVVMSLFPAKGFSPWELLWEEKWREGIWECFASFCVWFWIAWEAQHIQIPMSLFKGLFVFIPLLPTQKIKFGTRRPGTDDSSGIDFYYI